MQAPPRPSTSLSGSSSGKSAGNASRGMYWGADAVEETLVMRRHQLAVLPDEPLRSDQEEGVVERSGPAGLALVDSDPADEVVLATGLRQPVHRRSRHLDGALPHPLPQLVGAAEGRGLVRPRVRGIEREERLREDGELDP